MYRLLTGVLLLLPLAASADNKSAPAKGGLKPGENLPGSFQPFNVTGTYKGRFHCLVSDYELEPVVMVFVRDLEATDALKDLFKQLDDRISKNPVSRLHAFAVFFSDELPDALANDDKREELAKRVEDLSKSLALKNVVFCLDSPKDVQKYGLGESWGTVVLYAKYRVVAVYTLPKADAKDQVAKIMADVGEKLKASKTK
jgi:hypothetical protein